jgi:hypothetical protein
LILISALIHINEYDNDIRTCILNIKKRFEFNDNIINYLKNLNLGNIDIKNKENILNKYLSIENNDKPLKQHIVYLLYLLNDDLSLFNNFTNSKTLYNTIKKYDIVNFLMQKIFAGKKQLMLFLKILIDMKAGCLLLSSNTITPQLNFKEKIFSEVITITMIQILLDQT